MSGNHFRALEKMYLAAPINRIFKPQICISEGAAELTMQAREEFHHAAGAVHGAVYFKMLDDAAFFAANSLETEFYVLTTSFQLYLTRPVTTGLLRSTGKVVNQNRTQFIAESVLYNADGREIGRGSGVFMRSKIPLSQALSYKG